MILIPYIADTNKDI